MNTTLDLIVAVKRENNPKREFLILNKFQGKHLPAVPSKAFRMFEELGEKVKATIGEEKVLVIGFAETATAIGTKVATYLQMPCMQTTREVIPNVEYLFFSEEHSHAMEQK